MDQIGKLLVAAGLALAGVGALVWLGARAGLGRLPGDMVIERPGATVYFPLTSMLLVSLAICGAAMLVEALRR